MRRCKLGYAFADHIVDVDVVVVVIVGVVLFAAALVAVAVAIIASSLLLFSVCLLLVQAEPRQVPLVCCTVDWNCSWQHGPTHNFMSIANLL